MCIFEQVAVHHTTIHVQPIPQTYSVSNYKIHQMTVSVVAVSKRPFSLF